MTHPGRPAPLAIDALPHIADGVPRALLMRALAATSEISLITDAAQNILHASRSFTTITGYSEQEMLGSNCRVLQGPGTSREVVKTIRDTLARGEEFRGDILNYRKDGSPFWNALKVTPLLGDDGRPTHFVSVQRDVTTRMALHEQLRFQATHDAVTGLPNRAALDPHLTRALEADGNPGARIAVGLLDLDGLRNVNNALGHDAGDEVLAGWAARLQARLLPGEFLARMGGDEFVLVVEDVPEDGAREVLAAVLERLGGSVESAFDAGGGTVRVGMSAGLALSPRDGTETRGLLRSADTALKLAKARENGRSQWWELGGPGGAAPAVSGATAAPHTAGPAAEPHHPGAAPGDGEAAAAPAAAGYTERLFNGGLRMFLQPAVDLSQGGVYLFEALARLELEDGRFVPPAAFLPHLGPADVDRLFRLGLDQVLAQLAEWDAAGFSTKVSINLAPSTLVDPGFPAFVEEALARHNIKPARLVLELLETEGAEWDLLSEPLRHLVGLGVGVAMDDLGAGYSSLKRLSMLPFTAVKIDRDMLTGLRSTPLETLSLIATLVQVGRDFDMTVVAEGLEDRGMTEAVTMLGAQFGQGYHLGRPMPAAEVPAWAAGFGGEPGTRGIRTALGALAFHWRFLRLGSPHPHTVQECPLSGYLDYRGAALGDVGRWHAQQHSAETSSGASRMIVDWLIREIRAESDADGQDS